MALVSAAQILLGAELDDGVELHGEARAWKFLKAMRDSC